MNNPDLATRIDMYGRMMIALEELEGVPELVSLIPEVRTNMVFAHPHAKTPAEVIAIDGRVTIINGMPRAAGRIRFGASGHMARFIIELMKKDPEIRAALDFANPPGFAEWIASYCRMKGWLFSRIDRRNEPEEIRNREESSMSWKATEAVRVTGGRVPSIICDAGGMGKEPVCIIVGNEPVGVAHDLCGIAHAYVHR